MARAIGLLIFLLLLLTGCAPPTPTPTPTPNPLAGADWRLTRIQGQPVLAEHPVYLHLWREKMTGEMGCNSYSTRYQESGGTLQIDQLAVTVQLCPDPAQMDQEAQYIRAWQAAALDHPAAYRLTPNTLEILDSSGAPVLAFELAVKEIK